MFDQPRPGGGMLGGLYDMPQVQQAVAPNYDAVLQQPVVAAQHYWDWRRRNGEQMAAAYEGMKPGASPEQRQLARDWMGNVAAGFVGGLKVEGPGIIAYHGSPHSFDRFDMSKIGTGEGAQAYGHGLYFAGNEKVAEAYRDAVTHAHTPVNPSPYRFVVGADANVPAMQPPPGLGQLAAGAASNADLLARAEGWLAKTAGKKGALAAKAQQEAQSLVDYLRANPTARVVDTPYEGKMYQVRINADPNSLLDWDKPLSEQPAAADALLQSHPAPAAEARRRAQWTAPAWSGGDPAKSFAQTVKGGTDYQALAGELGSWSAASDALRQRGIPGIQYLDAGSRAAGDGTRNYVIFDDKLIDILKKYGLAGLLAGGAGGSMFGSGEQ